MPASFCRLAMSVIHGRLAGCCVRLFAELLLSSHDAGSRLKEETTTTFVCLPHQSLASERPIFSHSRLQVEASWKQSAAYSVCTE